MRKGTHHVGKTLHDNLLDSDDIRLHVYSAHRAISAARLFMESGNKPALYFGCKWRLPGDKTMIMRNSKARAVMTELRVVLRILLLCSAMLGPAAFFASAQADDGFKQNSGAGFLLYMSLARR